MIGVKILFSSDTFCHTWIPDLDISRLFSTEVCGSPDFEAVIDLQILQHTLNNITRVTNHWQHS